MRSLLVAVALLALTGCDIGDEDEAGSTTGPGVSIHCGAQTRLGATPQGDTTTVVRCPGSPP